MPLVRQPRCVAWRAHARRRYAERFACMRSENLQAYLDCYGNSTVTETIWH